MRVLARFAVAALGLSILAACADGPPEPTAVDPVVSVGMLTTTEGAEVEIRRPKIDVTKWLDDSELLSPDVFVPAGPTGIGTGSPILITIPDEGRFGCTANFVWRQGSKLYLGSAGHCFLPGAKTATHGENADYDASGVTVQVCVEGCEGNFRSSRIVGKFVNLGRVAYARQTDPTGEDGIGNDFGVVEIPADVAHLVRLEMPVWGAYKGVETLEFGKYACHYGNGVGVGEVFLTKARVGLGGGSDADFWMGDFAAAFGDSGSGLISCKSDLATFRGEAAVGVLTHLGVGTGELKYKGVKSKAEHGFVFGTTVRRAREMAAEAGLSLSIVEP